jgi:branched-chain amino acid transport system ATP-binding protein
MILRASGLNISYGEAAVLHDIGIEVAKGQIITVIGPNGAGKTTLLNAIMGVHGGAGSLYFSGRDVTRMPVEARVRAGMSLVPEKRELFTTLPVEDNLRLGGFRFRREGAASTKRQLDEIYALFPRLRERRRNSGRQLSGGEQQRLAIGRALMGNPSVLLLDEPSEGLAPLIVAEVGQTIKRLKSEGQSIILVEQNRKLALDVADQAVILNTGRCAFVGTAEQVRTDEDLVAKHLGVYHAH